MKFIATKVRDVGPPSFFEGSALYRLSEPKELSVLGFLTECHFVIVAYSPHAADHGEPETTVFAANEDGSFFGGFMDEDSPHEIDHTWIHQLSYDTGAEFERCRVRGRRDHRAALLKLGYEVQRGSSKPKPFPPPADV